MELQRIYKEYPNGKYSVTIKCPVFHIALHRPSAFEKCIYRRTYKKALMISRFFNYIQLFLFFLMVHTHIYLQSYPC